MPETQAISLPQDTERKPTAVTAWELVIVASLVIAFCWCVVSMLLDPHKYPVDDAFFYMVIANNFAHGLGSTFNGLTTTNGYHPLWMLVQALVARWSPFGKGALIYEITALQFLLMLVGIFAIYRIFRRSLVPVALSLGIYELIFLGKGTLSLMECWLAMPLLLLAVLQLVRLDDPRCSAVKTRLWLGIFLAAASLSRLEIGFTSGLMWLCAIWITHRRDMQLRRGWAQTITSCLGPLLLTPIAVGIYLILNKVLLGSAMPISGKIKSSFPHPYFRTGGPIGIGLLAALLIGILALALQFARGKWRDKRLAPLELALIALGGGLTISLSYDFLFSVPTQWYFVEGYCYIILGFPLLALAAFGRRRSLLACIVVVLALATCTLNYLRRSTNFMLNPELAQQAASFHRVRASANYLFALDLGRILPPQTGVLMRDSPGVVAYYTDLKVFPADGLVASASYSSDLVRQGALNYFCRLGVDYVVAPEPSPAHPFGPGVMEISRDGDQVTYKIYSPIGHRYAGEWTVPYAPVQLFPEISPQYHTSFPLISLRRIPCNLAR